MVTGTVDWRSTGLVILRPWSRTPLALMLRLPAGLAPALARYPDTGPEQAKCVTERHWPLGTRRTNARRTHLTMTTYRNMINIGGKAWPTSLRSLSAGVVSRGCGGAWPRSGFMIMDVTGPPRTSPASTNHSAPATAPRPA
jgi:hypothetical protein